MEKIKNNKGITLVMLVVTIIVLLILAGISISAITGGDSAMEQGQKAKNETEIQAEMEELQKIINQSAAKGIRHGNYSGSADSQTIRNALKKNKLIEENPDDVIIDGKNGWKVTGVKTGQKYKIKYDGEVTRIEELAPTKIYGKIADGVLYLRATEQTGYTEGTKWNDATITKVIIEEPIAPTTCKDMFNDCSELETIENIENLHTENATNMQWMFRNCCKLKYLDITNFDTSNVANMASMFERCRLLKNIDFTNFDTSNVNNMTFMFYCCNNLEKLDLNSFNTSNVTTMACMFCECNELISLKISNFDTQKVSNMSFLFLGCNKLQTLNISNFNTKNVLDMQHMFNRCYALEIIDLSNFDTSNVTNMGAMFIDCRNLSTIYVSNKFVTEQVTTHDNMFMSNWQLVGGSGTTFKSANPKDKAYAHIDGGPSNPGYFTLKP